MSYIPTLCRRQRGQRKNKEREGASHVQYINAENNGNKSDDDGDDNANM